MHMSHARWLRESALLAQRVMFDDYAWGDPLAAWAASGYNAIGVNAAVGAQLACTAPSPEPFRLPYAGLVVLLPPSVFPIWDVVTILDTFADSGDEVGDGLYAQAFQSVAGLERPNGTRNALFMYGQSSDLAAGRGEPGHQSEWTADAVTALVSACAYVRNWSAFRESSHRSVVKYRTPSRQTKSVSIWNLFKEIKIGRNAPTAETARAIVTGREPPGLHLVRGHWKRVHGNLTWVMPYLRGVGDAADAKVYS